MAKDEKKDIITPEDKEEKEITLIDGSIKDLTTKRYDDLIDKNNKFLQIFTRAADPNAHALVEFHSVDEKMLETIAEKMPAINRMTRSFGKSNSQVTSKMMSLQMISNSPYKMIKQALAKIERKRAALKESMTKLRKDKVGLDRLVVKKEELIEKMKKDQDDRDLFFSLQEVTIDIEEKVATISDSGLYLEGALKEILMFQKVIEEIKESHNISDDWDEQDVEGEEVRESILGMFTHLIRDLEMTGRINCGTSEWLFQFGINPTVAIRLTRKYLNEVETMMSEGKYPDIKVLYNFLDNMVDVFKDQYKHAMKRIGIKNLIYEDCLYIEKAKKEKVEIKNESIKG